MSKKKKIYECWEVEGSKRCVGYGVNTQGRKTEICKSCYFGDVCNQATMTRVQAKKYFLATVDGAKPEDWGVAINNG